MNNKEYYKNIYNIKPGNCFYDNQWNYKYHIVILLLDEQNPQIIYKYFGRHKQWWHYKIESLYLFNRMLESNLYSRKRFKEIKNEMVK